jgi:hypothetical protein
VGAAAQRRELQCQAAQQALPHRADRLRRPGKEEKKDGADVKKDAGGGDKKEGASRDKKTGRFSVPAPSDGTWLPNFHWLG